MKRVLPLSACVVLLCTTLQYGQNLANEKILYHSEDTVRWTQCALGRDAVLWVVWVKGLANEDSGGPVWIVSYDGTTVSRPFNVTEDSSIRAGRPHVAVSPKGHVLVSWGVFETKSNYIRVWNYKTKTWGPIEVVNQGDGGSQPTGAMDKDGNIHVFFSNDRAGQAFARSKINGTWESTVKLSKGFAKQGALAVGSDGKAHAVWIEKGGSGLYENYYTSRTLNTTWYTREGLPGESGASGHPQITVGHDNKAIVVWQDVTYPDLENGSEIRVLKVGSSYETAIDFAMQHFPHVVVDSNNKIHVVTQLGSGDGGFGLRYSNNVGGTWMESQTVAAAMPKVPGLASDAFGNVAATMSSWTSGGGLTGTDILVWSLNPIKKEAVPEAVFTFSPTTGYPPLTVNFNALTQYGTDGKEVTYAWVFGGGGTASGRNVSHVYQTAGTFKVTLTITDSAGRTDDITQAIVVKKTNPLIPYSAEISIAMTRFWKNPEITFTLSWAVNPNNIPEHIEGYAIYMKEGTGEYTRLKVVSPSTLAATFPFNDLSKKRSFAVSTLGYGGTESPLVYFQ